MQKFRALDNKDLDSVRLPSNPLWPPIQVPVFRCFGKLATMVLGRLQSDELLQDNYVKEFNIEKDKEQLSKYFRDFNIAENDQRFIVFAQKHKQYLNINVLRTFDDLHISEWIQMGRGAFVVLLGNQGNGKSSFILYLLKSYQNNREIIILNNNLAMVKYESEVCNEIYLSLIDQIDKMVMSVGKEQGLSERAIVNERFESGLRQIDAVVDETSDKEYIKIEKERRRSEYLVEISKAQMKLSRECLLYLRTGIEFLRKHEKIVCIIFDDVDRLSDLKAADAIRRELQEINQTLDVPIIVSMREITVKKMGDEINDVFWYHILPPSFQDLVWKRFITFKNMLNQSPPAPFTVGEREYRSEDYIRFTETIINSVTNNRENLFLFYMLSNSNLELMLDYLKTLLASSHYDHDELKEIVAGKLLTEHKIVQTLMLYVYREMNRDNTFIINIYDSEESETSKSLNNLFRIRALQAIREYGERNKENKKSIRLGDLQIVLDKTGYGDMVGQPLHEMISTFAKFSIVGTSIFGYNYQDDTEVILYDSAYYYLDYLIYTYRYMETAILDTHLDYEVNEIALMKGDLKEGKIDEEIEKFIRFIEKCEEEEGKYVKEPSILKKLNSKGTISRNMKVGYDRDKSKIIKSKEY